MKELEHAILETSTRLIANDGKLKVRLLVHVVLIGQLGQQSFVRN